MKVTLNIAEDKELRNYIKDMIKGQVLSIAREEISDILSTFITKRVRENSSITNVEKAINDEITKAIRKELTDSSYNKPNFIKQTAQEIIREAINQELGEFLKNKNIL